MPAKKMLTKELYEEYMEWLTSIEEEDLRTAEVLIKNQYYSYAFYVLLLALEKLTKVSYAVSAFEHVHKVGMKFGHNVVNTFLASIKGVIDWVDDVVTEISFFIEYLHGYANALGPEYRECRRELQDLTKRVDNIRKIIKGTKNYIDELKKLSDNIVKDSKIKSADVMYVWHVSLGLYSPFKELPTNVGEFLSKFEELKSDLARLSSSFDGIIKEVEKVCKCLSGTDKTFIAILTVSGPKITTKELRKSLLSIEHSVKRVKTYITTQMVALALFRIRNSTDELSKDELVRMLAIPIHLSWIRYPPSDYIREGYRESLNPQYLGKEVQTIKQEMQYLKETINIMNKMSKLMNEERYEEAFEELLHLITIAVTHSTTKET